jgi:DNA-binding winged helix-turn-helix (wHTH) protein
LDILTYLADRPGEVIAKQELMDHVWSDVTVEEGTLRVHIAAIRKALGDGQFGDRYIANIKGRGYSFVGTVIPLAGGAKNRNAKLLHQDGLPVRPTMMIGRETVVSEVGDKLRNERFITLLGPGCIGKATSAFAVVRVSPELLDLVRSRNLIVVLDSCEHVIKTVALLAEQLNQESEQVRE